MNDETPKDNKRRDFLLHAVKCDELAAQTDDARIKEQWSRLAAKWKEMAMKIEPVHQDG